MENNEVMAIFAILKENVKIGDGYTLTIDNAPIYGGYRINRTNNDNGGQCDFSGLTRKSKKEIIAWMRGYLMAVNG